MLKQFKFPDKRNFRYCLLAGYCLLVIGVLLGCIQKSDLEKAREYEERSTAYYERAITQYKELILKGGDLEGLYLELGKLYYRHKDFENAVETLKNTKAAEAKKLMAESYYHLGDFTRALEIFNKENITEDEYLYYYGLTCEKLNLFDKALQLYQKIKSKEFLSLAQGRINTIEKQTDADHIEKIDPAVSKILASIPSEEEYPQAGALVLLCNEKIEITQDNTQISSLHYIVKIINERGKEEFSEAQIDYDSTYERVELEYARTIKPDGRVNEVGSRHIRDVSKYLNFPLYSNARVYIISFPEITEGAVIEYKVKIYRSQLVNKKDFIVSYPVQASEPIIKANFDIILPSDRILHIKTLNEEYNDFEADLKPKIRKDQGSLLYSWQFDAIPQIIPESNMPAIAEINPAIIVSTFSSWQEVYEWWWGLTKNKIEADNAIKEKVSQLIAGLDSDEAKIRAIYNFCAQKIRYVAVEYGQAGHEPHNATDIFKNKYGDCKDQAILLVTMLKEASFSAWPILISTKGGYNLDKEFPAIFFNHCIACVSLNDKTVFLDPTAETCAFGDLPIDDQSREVLVFKEDGYEIQTTPLYPAQHNKMKQQLLLKINNDESIAAEKTVFTYGMYDQGQRYWMLYTPPELIEEQLKKSIQDVSIGATLDNYEIKNLNDINIPIVLNYRFKGPEYFTVAGLSRIMPQLASVDTSLVAKTTRRYPIDFVFLDTKETTLEVELPENMRIKFMPQDITEDSPWLQYTSSYTYQDNKIYFQQRTELKKNFVSIAEYPEFKAFFENLATKNKQRIILEKAQ